MVATDGNIDETLQAVDTAIGQGAHVIALTSSHSALVKRASVAINVDYAEDDTTQLPMISRILFLLVIDILAVGVSMLRPEPTLPVGDADSPGE